MTEEEIRGQSEAFSANERFYKALTNSNLEQMESIWSHDGEVRCIHPGWDVLVGWRRIQEAWDAIFSSSSGLQVTALAVEIVVMGEVAWVHCLEEIRARADREAGEVEEGLSFARATNLFRSSPDGWKMILHHASPSPGNPDEAESGPVH